MSIIERLFPASELDTLRETCWSSVDEPTSKRRRLNSDFSIYSRTTAGDSGYSSEDGDSPNAKTSPRKRSHLSREDSSFIDSGLHTTHFVQSDLPQKHLSSMYPSDRAKFSPSSNKSSPKAQQDPEDPIETFFQQAETADLRLRGESQSQSHSSSSPPSSPSASNAASTPASQHHILPDEQAHEWTTNPTPAFTTEISYVKKRILTGVRMTPSERMLLHSLVPEAMPFLDPVFEEDQDQFKTEEQDQDQVPEHPKPTLNPTSSFAGLVIPADDDCDYDNENQNDYEPNDKYYAQKFNQVLGLDADIEGGFEHFFNIDAASAQEEENQSPFALSDCVL